MRILQCSDIHLMSDMKTSLAIHNVNNYTNFLNFVMNNKRMLNIDCIAITGDISHDGGYESYDCFFKEISAINIPFFVVPGNHDDERVMNAVARKYSVNPLHFLSGEQWQLFGISSVVLGEDYGFINESTFDKLEKMLFDSQSKSVALFLHHHLFNVGTPLVDEIKLKNVNEFLKLCRKYNVKFIGTGHAHSIFVRKVDEIVISSSPAICSQWENGTKVVNTVENSCFNIISLGEFIHVETYII